MALDLAAQRDGIKTRLATITGLIVHDVGVDTITPPAAVVLPDPERGIDYHQSHGKGLTTIPWQIVLLVARDLPAASQDLLDSYLGSGTGQTRSVFDALNGDVTLGGVAEHLIVEGFDSYGRVEWGGVVYLGATVRLKVRQKRP